MRTLSFVLLALLPALALAEPAPPAPAPPAAASVAQVQEIEIQVHDGAYHPARVEVKAGVPVRLRFLKTDWDGCTRDVVLWTGERHTLPTGQPVVIEVGPLSAGTYGFVCGMGMVKGSIVVAP